MACEAQDTDKSGVRVIALSATNWFGTWMNRQHLMSRLGGRGWQVLYSGGPLNFWFRKSQQFRRSPLTSEFRKRNGVTIDIPGRCCPRWPSIGWWDRYVLMRHARRLAGWAGRSETVLYIFEPEFAPYLRFFPTARVVYHPYDRFASMIGADKAEICTREKQLVDRADLVIGTSPGVISSLPSPGPQKARLLPNGASLPADAGGAGLSCPDDLTAIAEPRIGYVGSINPKLDFRLLTEIADARRDYSLVFVGPDNMRSLRSKSEAVDLSDYERLLALPNVYCLGGKPQDAVAHYAANMTVNIIPYVTEAGHWAAAGSPLKLFEYLSVGRPVVSAALDVAKDVGAVVDVARTKDDWLRALDFAVTQSGAGTPEERIGLARENSWDRRVDQLDQWLLGIVKQEMR